MIVIRGVVLEWIATASATAAREVAREGERGFYSHVTCTMIVTTMQRKSFGKMACPITRSLERVGEILWPGHGALFRIPRRRATFLAPVEWIPPRHGCDRRWLAFASPNRFAQLAVRSARLRLDRLRCRAYGGDQIRSVVWSRAIQKCARLGITMNVAGTI